MKSDEQPLDTLRKLSVNGKNYNYYSLEALASCGYENIGKLPVTLKILLENLLRHFDGKVVTLNDIEQLAGWTKMRSASHEVAFMPARVLMQDFTGVPAVVDLAAMRDAVAKKGADPALVNPTNPVDLIIDHSVMVDSFAQESSYKDNVRQEMERNRERYEFLRWGKEVFNNFRVVPPGTGICHQVNLEYLAKSVWHSEKDGERVAYPDTLVGTDSHTTMINSLAVLGWGVGGIEAEAAMLGQPLSMRIPEVVGFRLDGRLTEGVTATDLVLTVAERLRQHGVVGKFVEFFGPGLDHLSLADRATISNMSPEYGATCSFFMVDQETLKYLELTGREQETIELVEAYSKAQGMWRDDSGETLYTSTVELRLEDVVPCLAGPRRPQDRVPLPELPAAMTAHLQGAKKKSAVVKGQDYSLNDGDVVIAAITSCTNTSNPAVMMAAGLVAKKALEKGIGRKPWVKSSLAPGSKVVTNYLVKAGLQQHLDELGFNLVGYGCTTCIGNSGPLPDEIAAAIDEADLSVSAVLSGNRNFEGRIHPRVRANWLGSPPLVVAFALAGTVNLDITVDPIGENAEGESIYLRDVWPNSHEIQAAMNEVNREMFASDYADVFNGNEEWNNLPVNQDQTYAWNEESTYIRNPPFFDPAFQHAGQGNIEGARILALLGDSITTDHISPAGSIARQSPAGEYLVANGVDPKGFNSYGSRRGNHEVMMRGTFANTRIRNEMVAGSVSGKEGGYTNLLPEEEEMSIYDAAMAYQERKVPLVVVAGKEYGSGSSRDWAAKGTALLGVRAVIVESFERIHRSNLAGMGVLPLQFESGVTRESLELTGREQINLKGLESISPAMSVTMEVVYENGQTRECQLLCRLDTVIEVEYFTSGGIMPYVLGKLTA